MKRYQKQQERRKSLSPGRVVSVGNKTVDKRSLLKSPTSSSQVNKIKKKSSTDDDSDFEQKPPWKNKKFSSSTSSSQVNKSKKKSSTDDDSDFAPTPSSKKRNDTQPKASSRKRKEALVDKDHDLESSPPSKKRRKKATGSTLKKMKGNDKSSKSNKFPRFWADSKKIISAKICTLKLSEMSTPQRMIINVDEDNKSKRRTWFTTQYQSPNQPTTTSMTSTYISQQWPKSKSDANLPSITINKHHKILKSPDKDLERPMFVRKFRLKPVKKGDYLRDFNKIFGSVRYTYNKAVDLLNDRSFIEEMRVAARVDKTSNRVYLARRVVNSNSPLVSNNPWLEEVKYDIRNVCMNEALTTRTACMTKIKNKTITHFKLDHRRKKSKSESIYCRTDWISIEDDTMTIKLGTQDAGNKYCLTFKKPKGLNKSDIEGCDCRIQRNYLNEVFLCVSMEYKPEVSGVDSQDPKKLPSLRVCALDPGVRTFQTIYDPVQDGGMVYHVGCDDINMILRRLQHIDRMLGKIDTEKSAKIRSSLMRRIRRRKRRISNLILETHKQLCKFLVTKYDVIMLPSFETKQMVNIDTRKINKKSVRKMLSWSHYKFKERLIFKARQYGKKVVIVNEAHTSKTCSCCGWYHKDLGSKKIYRCEDQYCKAVMDRDVNGAKNIFLKNCEALGLRFQN